tara:strand:- start:92 stop:841 length:750 start_codon:yes stop_codon:yes gene_type:complete
MAGHSKFKNIMHRKGSQDRIRAKLFSKLTKEISVAAKIGGSDIESNIRLKSAIIAAKGANMPKDNIERAINKGQGNEEDSNYVEVRYEGYGPSGTALIVEALTNNKNRTASEIRSTFSKNGGRLAETNSVSHNFEKVGNIILEKNIANEEEIFNFAIEKGSIDFETNEDTYSIYCDVKNYHNLIQNISKKYSAPKSHQIFWQSKEKVGIGKDSAEILFKLINKLEENDDVQSVFSNFEVSDEIMNQLIN